MWLRYFGSWPVVLFFVDESLYNYSIYYFLICCSLSYICILNTDYEMKTVYSGREMQQRLYWLSWELFTIILQPLISLIYTIRTSTCTNYKLNSWMERPYTDHVEGLIPPKLNSAKSEVSNRINMINNIITGERSEGEMSL